MRIKTNRRKDKAFFARTAKATKKKNLSVKSVPRGGICL